MTRARKSPAPTPIAELSHEFRTPLNGVLGMARLLEGTRLTAEQKTYVAALRQSGDHLLSLVNDVLDLAKLEAGKLTLNPAPTDLGELLQYTAELLSPRASAKGLEIAWAVPAGLPTVIADAGRLKQVLFNLTGNAIKFTETGGVLLGVEVGEADAKGLRVRLTVADTGPGIPKARQHQIFEAFAHDGARTDSAGLGLAIVERLAKAQGGSVGVESTRGDGAVFWLEARFPIAADGDQTRPLRGQVVTIASPSSVVRESAARQVRAAGGRAITCLTLEEAEARSQPGAVVLIDQALARGKRIKPLAGRPCLILLHPEERARIGRSRAAGYAGYLIKPLRQRSLSDRVLDALGKAVAPLPAGDERASAEAAYGARVLLVEDNPINALLASKLLEREGCSIDRASSAEAAMIAAAQSHYDLILMDRRLPGVDGLTATRRLRSAGVTAPIVALTADAFEEDRAACLGAGMDDFLTKPLDPQALRGILARAFGGGWTKASEDAKLAS